MTETPAQFCDNEFDNSGGFRSNFDKYRTYLSPKKPSMSSPLYRELLKKLLVINRERRVRFGIETTQELLDKLGRKFSCDFPIVHVAGSNGKGSVSLKIAKQLEHQGLRVGSIFLCSIHFNRSFHFAASIFISGASLRQWSLDNRRPGYIDAN